MYGDITKIESKVLMNLKQKLQTPLAWRQVFYSVIQRLTKQPFKNVSKLIEMGGQHKYPPSLSKF